MLRNIKHQKHHREVRFGEVHSQARDLVTQALCSNDEPLPWDPVPATQSLDRSGALPTMGPKSESWSEL
jgi:hypothetical protein